MGNLEAIRGLKNPGTMTAEMKKQFEDFIERLGVAMNRDYSLAEKLIFKTAWFDGYSQASKKSA